jgi:molybdopterin/thiamine biosynthesis adenylyltransferase
MKKRKIIFPQTQWDILTSHFSAESDQEQAAFAYASVCQSPDRLRLLVNEVQPIPPEDLEVQTGGHVIPKAEAIRKAVRKAVDSSWVLLHLHNHLWHGHNQFSATDRATIEQNFLWGRENFNLLQAAIVIGLDEGAVDALLWSPTEDEVVPIDELQVVGSPFRIYIPAAAQKRLRILDDLAAQQALPRPASATLFAMTDRLTRAFGLALQRTLSQLRVGIVGLSGTGSHLYIELARLGVEDFVLCDPDAIGLENLDRIMGATYDDAVNHRSKVAVAEQTIKAIRPWARVEALECSVFAPEAIRHLKGVDILFGCTDNHSSRLLLNKLSRQYFLPYVDVGTGIFMTQETDGQKITTMGGQVHIMLPDAPCLDCRSAVDRTAAAEELMPEEDRAVARQRGYVSGDEIIQPQVVQLNGAIVNLAVNECLNLFSSFKEHHSYLVYDALKPGYLAVAVKHQPTCLHCHVSGIGDAQPVWGSTPPSPPEGTPDSPPLPNGDTTQLAPVPTLNPGLVTPVEQHNTDVSSQETPKQRFWGLRHGGMSKWLNPFRTTPTSGK